MGRMPGRIIVALCMVLVVVRVLLAFGWLDASHAAWFPQWWPRTFIEGAGLTPFKLAAEYGVIAITAGAAWITILSELCLTLYGNVFDLYSLLGHAYEIVACFFIHKAAFVTSVRDSYARLRVEVEERRNTYRFFDDRMNRESIERLSALKALGAKLSIDDFGTVRAIIQMAASMGLKTIAEGVETESSAALLADLGCDEAQGYLFARPMPADELAAWLRARADAAPGAQV